MNFINESFELSATEAGRLWADALPMPASARRHVDAQKRIRMSENGQWVIRMHDLSLEPYPLNEMTSEEVSLTASAEFERLQSCDIDVISRGVTASALGRCVFTVTPWITGLSLCTPELFRTYIQPKLGDYNRGPFKGPVLPPEELARHEQYSVLSPVLPQPFLHDVDTRLYF